jgi:hypothetical protein
VWKWTFALSAPPALWINVTAAQRPSAMPMPRAMRRVQAKMRRTKMRKVGVTSAGSRSSSRRTKSILVDLSMLAYIARTIGLYQHAMPPFL